jgi:divalent metal cation (Fe/Co/Zn/Cd) transporter
VAERFHLKGVDSVRVRKAGRRVFVMVSFFEDGAESMLDMDRAREAVVDEMIRLNPEVDVVVAFRLCRTDPGALSPEPETAAPGAAAR